MAFFMMGGTNSRRMLFQVMFGSFWRAFVERTAHLGIEGYQVWGR